jgi:hypothetical protein
VNSFGFREFDGDMAVKEIEDGCEDARKRNLQERKEHAIATCHNIGRSAKFLDFIITLIWAALASDPPPIFFNFLLHELFFKCLLRV